MECAESRLRDRLRLLAGDQSRLAFDVACCDRGRVYLYGAAVTRVSMDGGTTWTRHNHGLGPISGEHLVIAKDGTLFKGGLNGGVYIYQFSRHRAVRK